MLNQISSNSPNKLLTPPNSIRYLAILLRNSLPLFAQSDIKQFSYETPYNTPLNQIPRNSLDKLLKAPNSIRYLAILLRNSLPHFAQSDIKQFP